MDPVLSLEEKLNTSLKGLMKAGKISEILYKELFSSGGAPPRLYGLAKTHKTDTPLRPFLSMCGSSYYNLASKLSYWLSVLPQSQINSSTIDTVKTIKSLNLNSNEILISYDVVSLYTNVPVDEAIEEAAKLLYSGTHSNDQPPVDKSTFVQLANLCLTNVLLSTTDGY